MEQEKLNQLIESANQGVASSQYDLAEYYKGVEDYFNALTWYIKAAEQGYEKALSVLFAPVEIEDKCNVIEIKPFYVQKAEEEEKARLRELEELKRKAAEANRRREEEARRKAEEEARLKAEEEARRKAEEEARLKAEEEARRKAEEEARLKAEEEARLKAEEETRLKAKEEARHKAEMKIRANHIKQNYPEVINAILDDMILVEGKSFHRFCDIGTSDMTTVEDFWVKKSVVSYSEFDALLNLNGFFERVEKAYCSRDKAMKFAELLSYITSFNFTVPSSGQLEYVLRGGKECNDTNFSYNNSIISELRYLGGERYHEHSSSSVLYVDAVIDEEPIDTLSFFRLATKDPAFFEYKKRQLEEAKRKNAEEKKRKAEEDARRKAEEEGAKLKAEEEERRKNKWIYVVTEWLKSQEAYEYKHGIIFGDKKKIVIVTQPITRRIWNAVVNHNSEMDFDSSELVSQKELGDFLKRLNESDLDLSQFDYLHNNSYAYGALSARKVIDEKGVYLYLKD